MAHAGINEPAPVRMPSLFDEISGFQFPDVLMNSGPLPSTAGGPAGSNGSIDGVINGTSALLENITPYAIGKSARTGSDRNYQQIPHRYQYIIPKIWLPDFHTDKRHHGVSHAVDQGDIAFLLYAGSRAWWTSREQFAPRAPQCAFAGIEVVNYILACLQASTTPTWESIRRDLIPDPDLFDAVDKTANDKGGEHVFYPFLVFQAVRTLVQQYFVPHGICAGSEKQGGQHEHDGPQAVIAPVNFVITMTVDGKNVDLVNYWYDKSMLAGDELIFRLEEQKVNKHFTLSSYYKDPQRQSITSDKTCWQLVPDILRHDPKDKKHEFCTLENEWRHHQSQGYWRVAQTFQTRAKNSIDAFHKGTPLEVTFAPVWQSFVSCSDACYYGNFAVKATVTNYTKSDPRQLCSVARKDSLTFWYGGESRNDDGTRKMQQVFKMESSQNYYTITFNPDFCKVHQDIDGSEVVQGRPIWKHTLPCLHLTFENEIKKNVTQNHKAHAARRSTKEGTYSSHTTRDYTEIPEVTNQMSTSTENVPYAIGVSGEYSVTLAVEQQPDSLYNAEFLRSCIQDHKENYTIWAGNILVGGKKDNKKIYNYTTPLDVVGVLVEYRVAGSSSYYTSYEAKKNSKLKDTSKREEQNQQKRPLKVGTIWDAGNGQMSRKPAVGTQVQDMNQHVPLLPTAAASDIAHVAGIAGVGALMAQAPSDGAPAIGPKPQKRYKKIKFLGEDPPQ
jgi:hypothetical protein